MTIRRDDLLAAAAAGLLQYRQIDPLLVFLLQRDIAARRQAMLTNARTRQFHGVYALLSFTVAVLALVTAVMFSMLFANRAVSSLGNSAYVFFALVYIVAGLAMAAWFRRRGYCGPIRLVFAVVMASVPLAVVALQQIAI